MKLSVVKLEDRIVLNADVPTDAVEGEVSPEDASSPDNGEVLLDMTLTEVSTEDAVPPAAMQGDVRVLVISTDITGLASDAPVYREIIDATKEGVITVEYNPSTSLDDLSREIAEALNGEKADSIAFASHGGDGYFDLVRGQQVNANSILNEEMGNFWNTIGSYMDEGGRVDLLACNVALDAGFVEALDASVDGAWGDIGVAASDDITGVDGDFYLEIGDVDLKEHYFTEVIEEVEFQLWEQNPTANPAEQVAILEGYEHGIPENREGAWQIVLSADGEGEFSVGGDVVLLEDGKLALSDQPTEAFGAVRISDEGYVVKLWKNASPQEVDAVVNGLRFVSTIEGQQDISASVRDRGVEQYSIELVLNVEYDPLQLVEGELSGFAGEAVAIMDGVTIDIPEPAYRDSSWRVNISVSSGGAVDVAEGNGITKNTAVSWGPELRYGTESIGKAVTDADGNVVLTFWKGASTEGVQAALQNLQFGSEQAQEAPYTVQIEVLEGNPPVLADGPEVLEISIQSNLLELPVDSISVLEGRPAFPFTDFELDLSASRVPYDAVVSVEEGALLLYDVPNEIRFEPRAEGGFSMIYVPTDTTVGIAVLSEDSTTISFDLQGRFDSPAVLSAALHGVGFEGEGRVSLEILHWEEVVGVDSVLVEVLPLDVELGLAGLPDQMVHPGGVNHFLMNATLSVEGNPVDGMYEGMRLRIAVDDPSGLSRLFMGATVEPLDDLNDSIKKTESGLNVLPTVTYGGRPIGYLISQSDTSVEIELSSSLTTRNLEGLLYSFAYVYQGDLGEARQSQEPVQVSISLGSDIDEEVSLLFNSKMIEIHDTEVTAIKGGTEAVPLALDSSTEERDYTGVTIEVRAGQGAVSIDGSSSGAAYQGDGFIARFVNGGVDIEMQPGSNASDAADSLSLLGFLATNHPGGVEEVSFTVRDSQGVPLDADVVTVDVIADPMIVHDATLTAASGQGAPLFEGFTFSLPEERDVNWKVKVSVPDQALPAGTFYLADSDSVTLGEKVGPNTQLFYEGYNFGKIKEFGDGSAMLVFYPDAPEAAIQETLRMFSGNLAIGEHSLRVEVIEKMDTLDETELSLTAIPDPLVVTAQASTAFTSVPISLLDDLIVDLPDQRSTGWTVTLSASDGVLSLGGEGIDFGPQKDWGQALFEEGTSAAFGGMMIADDGTMTLTFWKSASSDQIQKVLNNVVLTSDQPGLAVVDVSVAEKESGVFKTIDTAELRVNVYSDPIEVVDDTTTGFAHIDTPLLDGISVTLPEERAKSWIVTISASDVDLSLGDDGIFLGDETNGRILLSSNEGVPAFGSAKMEDGTITFTFWRKATSDQIQKTLSNVFGEADQTGNYEVEVSVEEKGGIVADDTFTFNVVADPLIVQDNTVTVMIDEGERILDGVYLSIPAERDAGWQVTLSVPEGAFSLGENDDVRVNNKGVLFSPPGATKGFGQINIGDGSITLTFWQRATQADIQTTLENVLYTGDKEGSYDIEIMVGERDGAADVDTITVGVIESIGLGSNEVTITAGEAVSPFAGASIAIPEQRDATWQLVVSAPENGTLVSDTPWAQQQPDGSLVFSYSPHANDHLVIQEHLNSLQFFSDEIGTQTISVQLLEDGNLMDADEVTIYVEPASLSLGLETVTAVVGGDAVPLVGEAIELLDEGHNYNRDTIVLRAGQGSDATFSVQSGEGVSYSGGSLWYAGQQAATVSIYDDRIELKMKTASPEAFQKVLGAVRVTMDSVGESQITAEFAEEGEVYGISTVAVVAIADPLEIGTTSLSMDAYGRAHPFGDVTVNLPENRDTTWYVRVSTTGDGVLSSDAGTAAQDGSLTISIPQNMSAQAIGNLFGGLSYYAEETGSKTLAIEVLEGDTVLSAKEMAIDVQAIDPLAPEVVSFTTSMNESIGLLPNLGIDLPEERVGDWEVTVSASGDGTLSSQYGIVGANGSMTFIITPDMTDNEVGQMLQSVQFLSAVEGTQTITFEVSDGVDVIDSDVVSVLVAGHSMDLGVDAVTYSGESVAVVSDSLDLPEVDGGYKDTKWTIAADESARVWVDSDSLEDFVMFPGAHGESIYLSLPSRYVLAATASVNEGVFTLYIRTDDAELVKQILQAIRVDYDNSEYPIPESDTLDIQLMRLESPSYEYALVASSHVDVTIEAS